MVVEGRHEMQAKCERRFLAKVVSRAKLRLAVNPFDIFPSKKQRHQLTVRNRTIEAATPTRHNDQVVSLFHRVVVVLFHNTTCNTSLTEPSSS